MRCHSIETPCETCKQLCPGRPGCPHPCSRVFCHAGACDPCHQPVKRPCFCGKTSKTFECWEVSGKNESGFFSGGKVCGKPLQGCRHGCRLVCHEGLCGKCEQEIVVKCACGSRMERIQCWKAQQMEGYNAANVVQIYLPCLDSCSKPSSTISQDKTTQTSKAALSKPDQTISKASAFSFSQRWLWMIALSVLIAVLSLLLRLFLAHFLVYCNKQSHNTMLFTQTNKESIIFAPWKHTTSMCALNRPNCYHGNSYDRSACSPAIGSTRGPLARAVFPFHTTSIRFQTNSTR